MHPMPQMRLLLANVHDESRLAEQVALLRDLLVANLQLKGELLLLGRELRKKSAVVTPHNPT